MEMNIGLTRKKAEEEADKLGLSGQARAQKINELMGNKASSYQGTEEKKEQPKKKSGIKQVLKDVGHAMTANQMGMGGAAMSNTQPVMQQKIEDQKIIDEISDATGLERDKGLLKGSAVNSKDVAQDLKDRGVAVTDEYKSKHPEVFDDNKFRLGNEADIETEKSKEQNKGGTGYTASSSGNLSNSDKNFLDRQAAISDYQKNNEMEKARKSEMEGWNDINNTIEQSRKAFKNIDDHYVNQIPTFMYKRYQNGDFGDPKSSDAKLRLAHFMINGLGSKLKVASNLAMINAGKSPMFADTTSDYEKLQNSNLEQGLANRWNKYKQETDAAAELARKQGVEAQDVKNALNKISTNANMQSAFNMMNEKQKVYAIKIISEIGDKIKDFDRKEVTDFLIGALVSDKNFSSNDLLAALGAKVGTDVLDSDTAQDTIARVKNYLANK